MSKFSDKLQRVYRNSAPSMGFRRSAGEAGSPPMLIVANLAKGDVKRASVIAGSVDAGVVSSGSLDADSFKQLVTSLGDIPLGLSLENATQGEVAKLADLDCDFVIFDLKTPLVAVRKEGAGKVLKIEPSLNHSLGKSINDLQLSIDGVLVAGEEASITVERLLVCQRFAELLNKPLLVTLASSATSDEISSLYKAGVNGLVVPEGLPVGAVAEMRKAIADLPRVVKRTARGGALLPQVSSEMEVEIEEDEEEEEV